MLNKEAEKELREANEVYYGNLDTFEDDKNEINHIVNHVNLDDEEKIKELESQLVQMIINVR